jgi:hypothetical protein
MFIHPYQIGICPSTGLPLSNAIPHMKKEMNDSTEEAD